MLLKIVLAALNHVLKTLTPASAADSCNPSGNCIQISSFWCCSGPNSWSLNNSSHATRPTTSAQDLTLVAASLNLHAKKLISEWQQPRWFYTEGDVTANACASKWKPQRVWWCGTATAPIVSWGGTCTSSSRKRTSSSKNRPRSSSLSTRSTPAPQSICFARFAALRRSTSHARTKTGSQWLSTA